MIAGDCTVCGVPDSQYICFNCFIQRPFERDVVCNVCGEEKPIVRLYLQGPACDECAEKREPKRPPKRDADDPKCEKCGRFLTGIRREMRLPLCARCG